MILRVPLTTLLRLADWLPGTGQMLSQERLPVPLAAGKEAHQSVSACCCCRLLRSHAFREPGFSQAERPEPAPPAEERQPRDALQRALRRIAWDCVLFTFDERAAMWAAMMSTKDALITDEGEKRRQVPGMEAAAAETTTCQLTNTETAMDMECELGVGCAALLHDRART